MTLRICPVCDEIATGEGCSTCADIERESEAMAQSLFNIGCEECSWLGAPHTLAIKVMRRRTEEKFNALLEAAKRATALDHPTTCRAIGCGNKAFYGDFCARCQEELEAGPGKPASRLSKVCHAAAAVAVLWYLLWQFRGYIYDCFNLWFGGK